MNEPVIQRFETLGSTNSYAKENALQFNRQKLTVVYAESQSHGRGRAGRVWVAPPGVNLYLTFCSFIPKPFAHLHNFSQILAISALETIEQLGIHAKLKWPNDLMLNGKKMAGILAEIISIHDDYWFIANGIGLNVNITKEALAPVTIPATSLFIETGHTFSREELLNTLISHYSKNFTTFSKKGFSPFLEPFKEMLSYEVNQPMKFHVRNEVVDGNYHSISPTGALQMTLKNGKVAQFSSGEELP